MSNDIPTPPVELRRQWINDSPGLAIDGCTRVGTDWNAVIDRAAAWGWWRRQQPTIQRSGESDLRFLCADAYDDADDHEAGIAAVLRTVAAEILELHHRAGAREIAQLLLEAADQDPDPAPDDDEPPETWDTHPSLTPAERNR